MQALVGCRGQESGVANVSGDPVRAFAVLDVELHETLHPLIANGDGRREDQGWLIKPADDCQAEHCLTRARRRDHVELVILQVFLELIEHTLLVMPPLVLESDAVGKGVHA